MLKLADIIIRTDKVLKVFPDETLSSALSKLGTSHDAAFIFSKDNTFLGVINPYYCLIKSSYPGNTKVEHCLFHPPRLSITDNVEKAAKLFIDSKVHYLPVFDEKENFVGIVSARRLLSSYRNSPFLKKRIGDILKIKNRPLVTIDGENSIASAVALFKKERISKLVVVGKDSKLKGVLSYYDLIASLILPKNSPERGERLKNKINFYHQKVKNFAKSYVLTLKEADNLEQVVSLILAKKIGSVVIVDNNRYPIGIITTKDLLRFFPNGKNGKKIEIVSKNLSQQSRQIVGGFFSYLTIWMKRLPDFTKARLLVQEEKSGDLFKVVFSLFPKRGEPKVIQKEGKNLFKVLKEIKKD